MTLKLTVTSASGCTVQPTLTYDYKCASCGTKTQLATISGFGLPNGGSLLLEAQDVLISLCRTCGKTDRILTDISAVPEHQLERVK